MNSFTKSALLLAATLAAPQSWAQITFYEHEGYGGRAFTTNRPVQDFRTMGFNDRASSAVVQGGRWEVCQDTDYRGSCVVLRSGNYTSLSGMGLNDRLSSARMANRRRADVPDAPPPLPVADYEYRRRPNERVFEAPVTSVRAVVGAPTERCWVERQEVASSNRGEPNVGRGLLGAVLGGVIGHQIGGGSGRDIATAGGAVAGAVIGANTGRDRSGGTTTADVRRCSTVPSTTPAYWDVSYRFRGVDHQMQTNREPGATVSVNNQGLPRQ